MERVELPMEPVEPRIASFFTKVIFSECERVCCLDLIDGEGTPLPLCFRLSICIQYFAIVIKRKVFIADTLLVKYSF